MHLMLIDIFNSIQVTVYDQVSGEFIPNTSKAKQVPVVYAGRSRLAKNQLNYQKYLNGPWISLEYSGLTYDKPRVAKTNLGMRDYAVTPSIIDQESGGTDIIYQYSSKPLTNYDIRKNPPIPVRLEYKLSILTQYQSEMDQIVQNIIANMNPYLTVSWKNPRAQISSAQLDKEIISKIIWNGQAVQETTTVTTELTEEERIVTEIGLIAETWIFPGTGPLPQVISAGIMETTTSTGEVRTFTNNYTDDKRMMNAFYDGDYMQRVYVAIYPSCAANSGAGWRFSTDPENEWRIPNQTVYSKIPADRTVFFRPISSWSEPAPMILTADNEAVAYYVGVLK